VQQPLARRWRFAAARRVGDAAEQRLVLGAPATNTVKVIDEVDLSPAVAA